MRTSLEHYWYELASMARAMPFQTLTRIADELMECHARGGTVFLLGNGGSAATASHFACDLAKGTRVEGLPAFRVVCLADNMPLVTAWGNDTSYDRIFAEQLEALVRPGDLVIVISASGNSPNVLAVPEVAHRVGARVIALTGKSGGRIARMSDIVLRAPSPMIEQVEDAHMAVAHSLCVVLRGRMRELAASRLLDSVAVPEQVPGPFLMVSDELDAPVA